MATHGSIWPVALLFCGACTPTGDTAHRDHTTRAETTAMTAAPRPKAIHTDDATRSVTGLFREVVESAHGPVGLFPVEPDFEGAVHEITAPAPGKIVVTHTTAQGIDAGEHRVTLDADGRVVRIEVWGRWGEPVSTSVRRWLDAKTAVVEKVARDGSNPFAPCRRFRETYASALDGDFLVEETCVDADDAPIPDEWGCVRYRYERYDGERRGMVHAQRCIGPDGAAVANVEGIHRTVNERDEAGCVTVASYEGVGGELVAGDDGIAVNRYERSPTCMMTARAVFSAAGEPTSDADGVHRTVYEVSAELVTRERRYDPRGQPVRSADDGAHLVRYTYDALGDRTTASFFDEEGRPIQGRLGFHSTRYTYTPEGFAATHVFVDRHGKPVRNMWLGVYRVSYVHDEYGELTEAAYFDARGRPMKDLIDQVPRVKLTRDAVGRVVERSYWFGDGTPAKRWSGSHAFRFRHDERGRKVSMETLDVDGRPAVDDVGVGRQVFEYDDEDRVVGTAFFRDGAPAVVGGTACIRGYHRLRREFDHLGRMTTLRYRAPSGEAVDATICLVDDTAHRIDFVYEGTRCVEQRFFRGESDVPSLVRDCRRQECVASTGVTGTRF
jgi:YD repeat-containing protein